MEASHEAIRRLLHPSSIAVVGASPHEGYGGNFWRNVVRARENLDVYPVNPKYDAIGAAQCYASLADLPAAPDVVAVVVPHGAVLDVLREAAAIGAGSAIVISAGFAERDGVGRHLQHELARLAQTSGIRLVGPNCLGIANVVTGVWATSSSLAVEYAGQTRAGSVAIVSQSGATAFGTLVPRAADLGIGLSAVISTGNEADIDFADVVSYLVSEEAVSVIAGYVEGFRDPRKFIAAAEAAADKGVPIVIAKTGRSEQGARAALSHTASLTGADRMYDGLFAQYGVIRADSFDAVLATAQLLSSTGRPTTRGVALLSHSGGVTALTADALGTRDVALPPLSTTTEASLQRCLGTTARATNPGDLSQAIRGDEFPQILDAYASDEGVGTVVVATRGNEAHVEAMVRARNERDEAFVFLWTGGQDAPALRLLREAGIPAFLNETLLADALAARAAYHDWLSHRGSSSPTLSANEPLGLDAVRRAVECGRPMLSEHEAKAVLAASGVAVTREVVATSAEEAAAAATLLGFPVAVKVDSWKIPHKSELGLVRLNVTSIEEVSRAYDEIAATAALHADEFGVLVQEFVTDAVELIVGVTVDDQLGPVILFGIGGVNVEVYDDVVTRVCPITRADAQQMIDAVRASKLVYGYRGTSRRDVNALASALVAISDVACALGDHLVSLDVNPLFVLEDGRGVCVGDALMELRTDTQ